MKYWLFRMGGCFMEVITNIGLTVFQAWLAGFGNTFSLAGKTSSSSQGSGHVRRYTGKTKNKSVPSNMCATW